jgi:3-hydroxybutyryl-CoA dehydratase
MNEYRLSDLSVGLSHQFEVEITLDMMGHFRVITGDSNPLHTDKIFANAHGYPERVSYGMLTASFYSTLVGMFLPGKYALLQSVDTSFIAPVFPGDKLKVSGEIIYIHEVLRRIEIRSHISNQYDKKVSKAKISAGINE